MFAFLRKAYLTEAGRDGGEELGRACFWYLWTGSQSGAKVRPESFCLVTLTRRLCCLASSDSDLQCPSVLSQRSVMKTERGLETEISGLAKRVACSVQSGRQRLTYVALSSLLRTARSSQTGHQTGTPVAFNVPVNSRSMTELGVQRFERKWAPRRFVVTGSSWGGLRLRIPSRHFRQIQGKIHDNL